MINTKVYYSNRIYQNLYVFETPELIELHLSQSESIKFMQNKKGHEHYNIKIIFSAIDTLFLIKQHKRILHRHHANSTRNYG